MKPIVLLTGKTGQVGRELLPLLPHLGELVALDRMQLNLEKPEAITRVIREIRPQLIINAAAYTAVDQAESDSTAAQAINAIAPGVMAEEAKKLGAALIHYSTDYVFDGSKKSPYEESDSPNPLNIYGKTKLAGEEAIRAAEIPHLIFRTSWVYSKHGKNFLLTMLRLAAVREELRIVSDQTGAPTTASYLAATTTKILTAVTGLNKKNDTAEVLYQVSGTYHLTAAGQTSWYGFANAIFQEAVEMEEAVPWFRASIGSTPTDRVQEAPKVSVAASGVSRSGMREVAACGAVPGATGRGATKSASRFVAPKVIPITTKDFGAPAQRPLYSELSNKKIQETFGVEPSDWREQLHSCFVSPR